MLSILIPVYNYDISQLIEVLDKQVNFLNINYEIIVGDDCSDNLELVAAYELITSNSNYNYFKNAKNIGRISTRLELARRAKYDWLLFLDADVLPKREDFVSQIISNCDTEYDLIFGGITYSSLSISKNNALRFKYGIHREVKSLEYRKKNPYDTIISQNFLAKKNVCLAVFQEIELNRYGLDIAFTYELKKNNYKVKHIDNPTIHLGLEDNSTFLKKSLDSVETTLFLAESGIISRSHRPIQKKARLLFDLRATYLFMTMIRPFISLIKRNLLSRHPSLLFFDIFRLYHFIKIKRAKYS